LVAFVAPRWQGERIYLSLLCFCIVIGFVAYDRPELLRLSRWRPRWADVAVGLCSGLAVRSLLFLFVSDPVKVLSQPYVPGHTFFQIAVLGSTLEEVVFRGVFLRSFKAQFGVTRGILLISFLATIGHSPPWSYHLVGQLLFSVLYLAMGDSLPASTAAHVAANSLLYLPLGEFFQKWHVYTIFKF